MQSRKAAKVRKEFLKLFFAPSLRLCASAVKKKINMNTTETTNHGSGNWVAFLFGVVFNLLASIDLGFLLRYALQAIVGGFICLLFKLLGDRISVHFQRQRERKDTRRYKKKRG